MNQRLLVLTALLGLTAACGAKSHDDAKATSAQSSDACPAATGPIDPTALIDDFEDGDALLPDLGGRVGGAWWTADDGTVGGTMVPPPQADGGDLAAPEKLEKPHCGSEYAMRVTGQGFTDWGAVLGMNFGWGKQANGEDGALPYDASAYTGVEFWARIGDTSTDQVRYQISDSNSEPAGGVCVDEPGNADGCYDAFGAELTGLDTTWRRYRIPFSGMSQRQFGLVADGLVTTAVYKLTFNFLTASPFDFWVDDLTFY